MRRMLALLVALSFSLSGFAQDQRASPKVETSNTIDGVSIKITYGQPSKKGRTIFGDLVPYDKVWRTGANEATVLEVSAPITIGDQKLEAGKYGLFTIPGKEKWTLIINSVADQWGSYNYDKSKDVLRMDLSPSEVKTTEKLTIDIMDDGTIMLKWDQTGVKFKVAKA